MQCTLGQIGICTGINDATNRVVVLNNRCVAHHGDAVRGIDSDFVAGCFKDRPQKLAIIVPPVQAQYARGPQADVRVKAAYVPVNVTALHCADPSLIERQNFFMIVL